MIGQYKRDPKFFWNDMDSGRFKQGDNRWKIFPYKGDKRYAPRSAKSKERAEIEALQVLNERLNGEFKFTAVAIVDGDNNLQIGELTR